MKHLLFIILGLMLFSCGSPTVKIAPSDKPIEINLNIKIEHNIQLKVDDAAKELVAKDKEGIF
jgi:hypothetical protein